MKKVSRLWHKIFNVWSQARPRGILNEIREQPNQPIILLLQPTAGAAEQYNFRWGMSSERAYKGGKFQEITLVSLWNLVRQMPHMPHLFRGPCCGSLDHSVLVSLPRSWELVSLSVMIFGTHGNPRTQIPIYWEMLIYRIMPSSYDFAA